MNVIYCAHQPLPGAPAFLRSSVESIPVDDGQRHEALISVMYGETALPLRSAVESIPSFGYVAWIIQLCLLSSSYLYPPFL